MTQIQIIDLIGLIFNLVGTIILAISLSKYLATLQGAIAIHDISLRGILNKDSKVLVSESMGKVLTSGVNSSAIRTKIGLGLIIVGFILQLIPFFI